MSFNNAEKSLPRNLASTEYFYKENNLIYISFRNDCNGFSICLGPKSSEECKHANSIEFLNSIKFYCTCDSITLNSHVNCQLQIRQLQSYEICLCSQGLITEERKRKDASENENQVFPYTLEICPSPQKGSNEHTKHPQPPHFSFC